MTIIIKFSNFLHWQTLTISFSTTYFSSIAALTFDAQLSTFQKNFVRGRAPMYVPMYVQLSTVHGNYSTKYI